MARARVPIKPPAGKGRGCSAGVCLLRRRLPNWTTSARDLLLNSRPAGSKGALMCPYEPHTQLGRTGEGGEHEPGIIATSPDSTDSAGVTVPNEPKHGNADTPVNQTRKPRNTRRTGHNLVVRGIRRDPPDLHKLAQVVASLAADMLEGNTDEQPGLADSETSDTATAATPQEPHQAA